MSDRTHTRNCSAYDQGSAVLSNATDQATELENGYSNEETWF